MIQRELYKEEVLNLFYKHENKNYFDEIISYLLSGECLIMLLCNPEGKNGDPIDIWKKMIGPPEP